MTIVDPHLDVEQVSAAVDGQRDAAVAAHLLACPACQAQIRTWQATLAPLGEPLPPPGTGAADWAVEIALTAWEPPPRRRRFLPALSVAAGIAVVALAVAAITGLAHGAGSTASSTKAAVAAPAVHRSPAPPGPPREAGVPPSASSGSSGLAPGSRGLGDVASAPLLVADLRAVGATAPGGRVAAATPCLTRARVLDGSTTAPVYEAAVDFEGTRGAVFVFPRASGGYLALVLRADCTLLSTVGL